jgi:hypothetical protein
MKNLQLLGFCLSLSFVCIKASAQNSIPLNEPDRNKPKLFSSLPDKIPVTIADLQNLLNAETGKDVSLQLKNSAIPSFIGKCVSAADKYNNTIHSVVIRSSNFNGATFTLSSSAQPNGTVKFTGRIISLQHGDAYVLQNQDDQYILIKKNFYDLINE